MNKQQQQIPVPVAFTTELSQIIFLKPLDIGKIVFII
jgi:hypothetical protein